MVMIIRQGLNAVPGVGPIIAPHQDGISKDDSTELAYRFYVPQTLQHLAAMAYNEKAEVRSLPPDYTEGSQSSHECPEKNEEENALLESSDGYLRAPRLRKKKSLISRMGLTVCMSLNIIIASANIITLMCWALFWRNGGLVLNTSAKVSSTSVLLPPSPAIDAIERELRPFTLSSTYTAKPGPITDQAWHDLVNTGGMFPMSLEEFAKVNDSPETGIKYTHDAQGRYLGTLAATHQIHCVNSLRKGLWFNYKHYKDMNDVLFQGEDPPEEHLTHCVEMIRNAVMCFGDVSVITYNWKEGHAGPKASFKSMHSCQKWDKIEEWRSAHNVTENVKTLDRPVGLLDKPRNDAKDGAFGVFTENSDDQRQDYGL
ncbi:hypothetical protein FHL15_011257 [Xylaria flabelliformis]|uniref:Tat pathway signal sequence n=1 Tax=Xylaria flabelliformis TaxID=2512241 RepID=A0A553HIR3_9PEZI|nr:hypothetical protein FHL15_011257 [Xylaria flabelliformis]